MERVDSALKARLVAFLEAGIDPGYLTRTSALHVESESKAQIYVMEGRMEILRSSLQQVRWDSEKISALLEDGATGWLSEELDRLKPWWQMFRLGEKRRLSIDCEERFDHYQRLYETKRATSLCEGYRKYFPEDEEEIREFVIIMTGSFLSVTPHQQSMV
jgi:hypothetical protein